MGRKLQQLVTRGWGTPKDKSTHFGHRGHCQQNSGKQKHSHEVLIRHCGIPYGSKCFSSIEYNKPSNNKNPDHRKSPCSFVQLHKQKIHNAGIILFLNIFVLFNSNVRFNLIFNIFKIVIVKNKKVLTIKKYACMFSTLFLPTTSVTYVQLPQ